MLTRWKEVVLGAAAFLAAHTVEVWAWRTWFAPAGHFAAWFLNSGRAVAFTGVCLFVVSAINSAFRSADQGESLIRGACFSGGAAAAMTVVLFVTGPGTIWPIVLVSGAAIVAASAVSGSLVGWAAQRMF
jgi:hypothetical protein